jgi:hypothetical protein
MVREYSADGLQPPQGSNDDATSLDLQNSAANLTQELAQLLAASIAQNQPGKRAPGGTPTGSELASLAALVSSQRAAVPSFKDGLSSLSYAPSAPISTPGAGSGGVLIERHDDEPMPIPSTWRQPVGGDDERRYRQQLGAAALGLVAGLIVVVPSVLWLSGFFGGPQARPSARHAAAEMVPVKVAEARTPDTRSAADIKPVKVQVVPVEKAPIEKAPAEKTEIATQFVASVDARRAPEPPPAVVELAPAPIPAPVARVVEPPRPPAEDLLKQVERRIGSGDVTGAREFLLANEDVAPGPITFALAETYDPIMLAAWGTRGVTADVVKAKSLYRKARDLGEDRAQMRLEQLR